MPEGTPDTRIEIESANRRIKELHERGEIKAALALATRTVESAREQLGEMDALYLVSLGNLAVIWKWFGRFSDAQSAYESILGRLRANGDRRSDFFARTLNNLAELYAARGDLATAEALHIEVLNLRESGGVGDETAIADTLSNLAQVYGRTGRHAEAEALLRRALEIDEGTVGKGHFLYGLHLSNLASALQNLGQHADAMRMLRDASRIIYETHGRWHPAFADALSKIAPIYDKLGDLVEAERLYKEALDINLALVGRTERAADILERLSSLYLETSRRQEAESALAGARDMRAELGQTEPSIRGLLNLAHGYAHIDDLDSSEALFRRAIELESSTKGEYYPPLASTLNNLAQVLKTKGNYHEAEVLYRRALAILSPHSKRHPAGVSAVLHNLGMLYAATDRPAEALSFMRDAEAHAESEIGDLFAAASERQRLGYVEDLYDRTSCLLSLVSQRLSDSRDAVRAAFELVLRRKGIATEAVVLERMAILRGRYPALEAKLDALSDLKRAISQDAWSSADTRGESDRRQRHAELRARLEQHEMEIAQEVSDTDLSTILRATDLSAVASALPNGTALIEYARFSQVDFGARITQTTSALGAGRYVAFVLAAQEPDTLRMYDLGDAWSIDRRIAKYREFVGVGDALDVDQSRKERLHWPTGEPNRQLGDELRRMVFDPFLEAIGRHKQLSISPAGDLTRLPFQVLPIGTADFLGDAFNIGYLSAGRDAIRFQHPSQGTARPPVVIADPAFELWSHGEQRDGRLDAALARPLDAVKRGIARAFARRKRAHDNAAAKTSGASGSGPATARYTRDLVRRGFQFEPLPGTRVEGTRVGDRLGVEPWLGTQALKSRLRRCRSPRVLHISTHGFFLTDDSGGAERRRGDPHTTHQSSAESVGLVERPWIESPLLRSGLALAGANSTLTGRKPPDETEGGLLTAEDISGLDLSNTELVTLPDCDTGLGELHLGEGVFGLRRSCFVAGARTVVMSLWKVPDVATAILMVKFYDNLRDGFGRRDALLAAQDYVRHVSVGDLRGAWLDRETIDQFAGGDDDTAEDLQREYVRQSDETRPFAHPFFWGAFICEGDQGPLEWDGHRRTERCRLPLVRVRTPGTDHDLSVGHVMGSSSVPHAGACDPAWRFLLPSRVDPDIGVVVSPDSRHVAYCVHDNHGMHVEVDGKPVSGALAGGYERVAGVALSARALAYAASRAGRWFVVFNGQEQTPWNDIGRSSPIISPDSRRVAYAARRGHDWYAVIDGVVAGGPYEGFAPGGILFSPDSRRYAYVIKSGASWNVIGVGVEQRGFPAIGERSLTFSPNSKKLGYVACAEGRWVGQRFVGRAATVVDGTVGQTWHHDEAEGRSGVTPNLYFSPDSEHLAYSRSLNGRVFVVVDSEEYGPYDGLISGWNHQPNGQPLTRHSERPRAIVFSPDSRRIACAVARGPDRLLVVLNEHQWAHSAMLNQPPVFSPDSQQVAYGVEQYLEQGVAIDGEVLWAYDGLPPAPWSFSPDSKLLAYTAWKGHAEGHVLAVNGLELQIKGSLFASSSIEWESSRHLHFLASDGQHIWLQDIVFGDHGGGV